MTREHLATMIRLALHDLGRNAYIKLPRRKAALQAMLQTLQIEQATRAESNLRDDIKARFLARIA